MGRLALIVKALGALREKGGSWARQFYVNMGGGMSVTAPLISPAGDDSAPLDADRALLVQLPRSGTYAIIGWMDTGNEPQAGKGEKRLYSRADDGTVKASLWLRATGEIEFMNDAGSVVLGANGSVVLDNAAGNVTLAASGEINLNGVTISTAGAIETPSTIRGAGITDTVTDVTLNTHEHPGNNTPPTPGT